MLLPHPFPLELERSNVVCLCFRTWWVSPKLSLEMLVENWILKIECVLNNHEDAAIRIPLINDADKQVVVGVESIRWFRCDSWRNYMSFWATGSELIQLNKCPQIEIENE